MFDTWYQVKGMLRNGDFRTKISQVNTHQFPLVEIDKAMETIINKEAAKVILKP